MTAWQVLIPKSGLDEMRPLSIPAVRDRVVRLCSAFPVLEAVAHYASKRWVLL
jgi:hypothetical protein